MIKYCGMTSATILHHIREKKSDIAMSLIFVAQMKEYEKINKKGNSSITVPISLIKRVRRVIKKKNCANVSDDEIKRTIWKHKRVKAIENIIKNGKKSPKIGRAHV